MNLRVFSQNLQVDLPLQLGAKEYSVPLNTWEVLYKLSNKRVWSFWGNTIQGYCIIFVTTSDIFFWMHKVNFEIFWLKKVPDFA